MDNNYALKFVNNIRTRLYIQNKNWIAVLCGQTGSGKSYSALSLAESIAKGDKSKIHIIFTPKEFFDIIPPNSNKLKKGDILIFDEAGVGMSSREWQSIQNKLLGTILQTFRVLNLAVIFTTPNLSFIDVQARKLLHCYMETRHIDYKEKIASISVYNIEVNSRLDKIYYKRPNFMEGNRTIILDSLGISKPSEDLVYDYEEKKKVYVNELNKNAKEMFESITNKNKSKDIEISFNPDLIVDEAIKMKKDLCHKVNGKSVINVQLVKNKFNLSERKAKLIKGLMEKKVKTHSHTSIKV